MITQPKRGDGEDAWRRYAGALRQQLGVEGRRVEDLQRDIRRLTDDLELVKRISSGRSTTLNRVYRELLAGDVPAATDRLARRAASKGGAQ